MPDIELRLLDAITDEERQRLTGWGENVFGTLEPPLEWRKTDYGHIMLYEDGKLMSHVGLLRHTVEVARQPIEVGGVGGVVTVGEAHGKGYATTAMRRAEEIMRDEMGVNFGMLFCFDRLVPFYQRLGWHKLDAPVHIDQPSGPTIMPFNAMVLPLRATEWPYGEVHLHSLPW